MRRRNVLVFIIFLLITAAIPSCKSLDGGPQSAVWDARDDAGNPVQPGAYFYTIQTANSGMASGKIMVVRE